VIFKLLNKLKPKSEFSRNVLTLMTGTTIAQAIPIAISPILTRIYTPEDFGMFALYMSVASIFSVIATGRYELAIMLPKKDEDAINIVILSIIISFFVSFMALLIVFFFNAQITNILGNPEISSWLYFIPITVLLTGVYQSFNYWSNRKKEYKRLATTKIIQSSAISSSNLGMGFNGFGGSGLILSGLLGQGIATIFLGRRVAFKDRTLFEKVNRLKIFVLAKKYKKLPIFNLPNALIDTFRLSGINILIANFFTTFTLGQFSLAWKMIQLPTSLIGGSLSQVFFQKISSVNRNKIYDILKLFIIKALFISLPMFFIIYIFAVDIFRIVFGSNWKLAGEIASILSPWLFLNFLTMPIANVFIILNRQEIVLMVSIVYMIVPIVILLFLNQLDFLYLLSIITFSMSIILIFYIVLIFIYTIKEKRDGVHQ
jgi:O-antigen/teichoic acid export membrane protein